MEGHLSENKKNEARFNLINQRRRLNKIKEALTDNPGAAIYGESPKSITNGVKDWIDSNFKEIH